MGGLARGALRGHYPPFGIVAIPANDEVLQARARPEYSCLPRVKEIVKFSATGKPGWELDLNLSWCGIEAAGQGAFRLQRGTK